MTEEIEKKKGRQAGDGRGRLGGRAKGTPNKRHKEDLTLKEFVAKVVNNNRKTIEADLKKVSPAERLFILDKFIQYSLENPEKANGDEE